MEAMKFKEGQYYEESGKYYYTVERIRDNILYVTGETYDCDGANSYSDEFEILRDSVGNEYFICSEGTVEAKELSGVGINVARLLYKGSFMGIRVTIYLTRFDHSIYYAGDISLSSSSYYSLKDELTKNGLMVRNATDMRNCSLSLEGVLDKETGIISFGQDRSYNEIDSTETLLNLIRKVSKKLD